jgi:hypothetical protein
VTSIHQKRNGAAHGPSAWLNGSRSTNALRKRVTGMYTTHRFSPVNGPVQSAGAVADLMVAAAVECVMLRAELPTTPMRIVDSHVDRRSKTIVLANVVLVGQRPWTRCGAGPLVCLNQTRARQDSNLQPLDP